MNGISTVLWMGHQLLMGWNSWILHKLKIVFFFGDGSDAVVRTHDSHCDDQGSSSIPEIVRNFYPMPKHVLVSTIPAVSPSKLAPSCAQRLIYSIVRRPLTFAPVPFVMNRQGASLLLLLPVLRSNSNMYVCWPRAWIFKRYLVDCRSRVDTGFPIC